MAISQNGLSGWSYEIHSDRNGPAALQSSVEAARFRSRIRPAFRGELMRLVVESEFIRSVNLHPREQVLFLGPTLLAAMVI